LKKRLFCLTLEGKKQNGQLPPALFGLEAIWNDTIDKPVGYLRRAEYAFTLEKGIGYGYIHQNLMPDQNLLDGKAVLKNNEFSIEIMGKKYPAVCYLRSPFDPKNLRVQGERNRYEIITFYTLNIF
jgi:glycine cleavage system aminomethyltransferase T